MSHTIAMVQFNQEVVLSYILTLGKEVTTQREKCLIALLVFCIHFYNTMFIFLGGNTCCNVLFSCGVGQSEVLACVLFLFFYYFSNIFYNTIFGGWGTPTLTFFSAATGDLHSIYVLCSIIHVCRHGVCCTTFAFCNTHCLQKRIHKYKHYSACCRDKSTSVAIVVF